MPPEYGLYAGMIPAIIAALFGSSWHLVSGPTTAASIVLFSAISAYAEPGSVDYIRLILTLTFMVGVIQLAMGLARLGTLVNFISHSVVIGFTAGAAILIIANQVKHFFGVDIERGLAFYDVFAQLFAQSDQINVYVVTIGILTLIIGMLSKRFIPKIPYMIVAMLAGTLVSILLNYLYGKQVTNIATIGELPATLPPLSAPDFTWETIKQLAPEALAVTLLALVEAVSIARSIGVKSGQHIDGNQEFIGQGLSNMAGSFFSGYVATGSFNRSGLNYEAGARTPLAAVFAAIFLMAIVVLVAPLASYLPNAAMAAILFLVGWGLVDVHHIKKILKASKSETSILLTTFFSTLFLELEFAIFLGVILSLVLYLNRTSKPSIFPRMPDPSRPKRKFSSDSSLPECPQLKILRVNGSLFFGAISHVRDVFSRYEQSSPEQKHLLLVSSGINFADVSGAEFLEEEAVRRKRLGGGLYMYKAKPELRERLRRGGYIDAIGEDNIFGSKREALHEITTDRLDRSKCEACPLRVFEECAELSKVDAKG